MNPGFPPSPEMHEALRAQKALAIQARIDHHRRSNPDAAVADFKEAAQSQARIERGFTTPAGTDDNAEPTSGNREQITQERLNELNDQAQVEIWGSDKSSTDGVLAGIRNNSDGYHNDDVFGKGQRERMEKAEEYEEEVLGMVEGEGLELAQAKLYMDLTVEAAELMSAAERRAKVLEYRLQAQGSTPENARSRAYRKLARELEGTEAETDSITRLGIIKDSYGTGVFTREEYEEVRKRQDVILSTDDHSDISDVTQTRVAPQASEEDGDSAEAETQIQLGIGHAERPLHGEDTMLVRRDLNLFGVFDGLGGEENGAHASKAAAEAVETMYSLHRGAEPSTIQEAIRDMKNVVAEARRKVIETEGYTTAIFGKVQTINGKNYLIWANAGDSRLFRQNGRGQEIHPISTDQSTPDGDVVYNSFGGNTSKHDQFGSIELKSGDRLMFCSDGITGDNNKRYRQLLTDEEMQEAFDVSNPQESADTFMRLSRKRDDKSIIVIDIE